mgnify:FL=1
MMTRAILITMSACLLSVLIACGENEPDTEEEMNQSSSDATIDQATPEEEERNSNGTADISVPFDQFDLEVIYENAVSYEVDFEKDGDRIEVEIDDDLNQAKKQGEEALSELEPIFHRLTFDEDTPNEEVIAEVLESFQLEDNFEKFELEVDFTTGTEKEYEETRS